MARHLADSLILPFNVSDYVVLMRSMATSLLKGYGAKMDRNGIDTGKYMYLHNLKPKGKYGHFNWKQFCHFYFCLPSQ